MSLDLNQGTQAEVDGAQLVNLVSDRLFPSQSITRYDDLAQPTRETKYLSERLIGRLASLQQPTWLVIDGLNKVRIGKTALDSLVRLCQAIERGECHQLWLFLIGLKPEELGPDLAPFVTIDHAMRPSRQDIEDYLVWFAANVGKTYAATALRPIVDELDTVLPPTPNHNSWREFHMALVRKCQAVQQGMLP